MGPSGNFDWWNWAFGQGFDPFGTGTGMTINVLEDMPGKGAGMPGGGSGAFWSSLPGEVAAALIAILGSGAPPPWEIGSGPQEPGVNVDRPPGAPSIPNPEPPAAAFTEGTTVTAPMPPPPGATYPGIPIPMPAPQAPPTNLPEEPLAGEVPDPLSKKIPPWLLPGALLNGIDVLNPFTDVPTGVPKDGGLPDWLSKLLKGLLLAGALTPRDDPGAGGPGGGGGGVTGGGASGGVPSLGGLNYQPMRGGGNFVDWNPGAGQQMLGGGGGGAQSYGATMAQLFGAGRR